MGFLGRGIGAVLGGPVGYMIGNQFDQNKGNSAAGPAPWKPLTANNINISPDLAATLGTIGTTAAGTIGSNYANAGKRQAQEAVVRGQHAPGNYGTERLAVTEGLDKGNLASALGGQMGSTAYNNALQEREYGQNLTLADQIAALNRPSTLQQIFQGIGAVGKPAATYAGMKGGGGGYDPTGYGGGSGRLPASLSLIPGGGY